MDRSCQPQSQQAYHQGFAEEDMGVRNKNGREPTHLKKKKGSTAEVEQEQNGKSG